MKNKNQFPFFKNRTLLLLSMIFFGWFSLAAQTETEKEENEEEEDILELSVFEVEATQGQGYLSRDAVSGLKMNKDLLDIPQSVQIVTRDVIEDLGTYGNTHQTVKYVVSGIQPLGGGSDSNFGRGFRGSDTYTNGVQEIGFFPDNANIDRVEIVKGPAAVLFSGRVTLAGLTNKITKKPLHSNYRNVRVIVGSKDFYRGEIDLTGPFSFWDEKLQYRLIFSVEDTKRNNRTLEFSKKKSVFASLQYTPSPATTLRFEFAATEIHNNGITNGILDPEDGRPWEGAGRFESFVPPWGEGLIDIIRFRSDIIHRFNKVWEMKIHSFYWQIDWDIHEGRLLGQPNFDTNLINTWVFSRLNQQQRFGVSNDHSLKYRLFGLDLQTNFGILYDRHRNQSIQWDARDNIMLSLTDPDFSTFPNPLGEGDAWDRRTRSSATRTLRLVADRLPTLQSYTNIYFMQTVNLWEDKLSIVGGFSYQEINKRQEKSAYPKRIGAVFKPVPGVALFVNYGTTTQPQNGFDEFGNTIPHLEGTVKEVGFKTDLWDGRLFSTVTFFDLTLDKLRVVAINDDGLVFFEVGNQQTNQGIEVDLGFKPLPNLTIITTYYAGDLVDQDGAKTRNVIDNSYSFLAKYDFTEGPLTGFSAGINYYKQGLRTSPVPFAPYDVWGATFAYQKDQWRIRVQIENLEDENYVFGGFSNTRAEFGPPLGVKFSFDYTF